MTVFIKLRDNATAYFIARCYSQGETKELGIYIIGSYRSKKSCDSIREYIREKIATNTNTRILRIRIIFVYSGEPYIFSFSLAWIITGGVARCDGAMQKLSGHG